MNKAEIENAQNDSISIQEIQHRMMLITKRIHEICEKHRIQYWLAYGSLLGAIRHEGFIPWDDDMDIMMTRKDFLTFMSVVQDELKDDYFLQTPLTDAKYDILHIPVKIRDNQSTLIEELNKDYHQGAFVDIFVMDLVGDDLHAFNHLHKKTSLLASLKMPIDFSQLSGAKRYIRILMQIMFKMISVKTIYKHLQKKTHSFIDCSIQPRYVCSGLEFIEKDIYPYDTIFPLQLQTFEDTVFYIPNNAEKLLHECYGDYMQLPNDKDKEAHGIYYSNKRFYNIPIKMNEKKRENCEK